MKIMKCLSLLLYKMRFIYTNITQILARKVFVSSNTVFVQKTFIRGKGTVKIGDYSFLGSKMGGSFHGGSIELFTREKNSSIFMNDNVKTNNNLTIISKTRVVIESNCLIGCNCQILGFDGHNISPKSRHIGCGKYGDIIIGNNVWIGNNCIILHNTIIGDNCVVAAGSIVKGDFDKNQLIGGVPAKVIRKI